MSQQRCVGVGEQCQTSPPSPGVCQPGLQFCLSAGRCVPPQGCPGAPSIGTDCPRRGEVYCAARRSCVPADRCTLSPSDRPRRDSTMCGPGTVFCMSSGHCEPTGKGCSPQAAFGCSGGTSYCMTAARCLPTPCPAQPEDPPKPEQQCEEEEIFCAISGQCQPSSEPCGTVCPPSHVICAGRTGCVSYRDCKNATGTGLAWTLPSAVLQDSKEAPAAAALSSLLHSSAVETLLDAQVVPSMTVEAADPGWWVSDSADGLFQSVTADSTLRLNQFVKFRPSLDGGLGVRRISLAQDADRDTVLRYSVVQYVLPSTKLVNITQTEFTIQEDQPSTLRLSDVIQITDPATEDEMGRLRSALAAADLDRTALGYRQLDSLLQPTVPVRIAYSRPPQRRSEVPGTLLLSTAGDQDNWTEHSLEQQPLALELPRDPSAADQPLITFMPRPDFQGVVGFDISVSLGAATTLAQLTVTVEAANDAPLRVGPTPDPLLVPLGAESVTVSVSELVSGSFMDPDGLATGAAVLVAAGEPLGRWEWAPSGADRWSALELPTDAVSVGLTASDCGQLPTDGEMAALSRRLTGSASCGAAPAELPPTTVTPQYLAPDDRLRFTANNASQVWTRAEAAEAAVLVVAGWDQTAAPNNISLPDCQPDCGGSSSLSASLLRVLVLRSDCTRLPVYSEEHASQLDACGVCGGLGNCITCDGQVNGSAYRDCTKCVGGTTGIQPERDCANQCSENLLVTINGTELCVPSEAARVPPCDGVPGSGAYFNLCGHCVLGSTGRPALYGRDACGQCVADPTADSGSSCPQPLCDGSVTSPRRRDHCGECRHPDSDQWSACRPFGKPPPVVDLAQPGVSMPTVQMALRNQTTAWDPTLVSCHVTGMTGERRQVITFKGPSTVTAEKGVLRERPSVGAKLVDLPPETYQFSCGTDLAADTFSLVNSSELQISNLETPEALFNAENKVAVVLSSDPVPTAPVVLGLVPPDGVRPALVVVPLTRPQPTPVDDERTLKRIGKLVAKGGSGALTALLPRLPSAGVYRVIVAHDRAGLEAQLQRGCDSECQSAALSLRVRSAPPEITGAEFAPPYRHVTVSFDGPVWTEQGCEQLLAPAALRALGGPEGSDCSVRSNQLLIRLGSKMAAPVSGSVELTLAEGGDIVQLGSGGGELASRASGSVTVNFTQAMTESPRVSLLGPSVVCASAGWRAAFRAVPEQDLGRPLSYSWNISLERETTLRQSDTLTIWQGINAAIATEDTESTDTVSSYTIDSSALVPGSFNYEVFVKAQAWTGASQIESRPFRVSSSGLSVSVTGPQRIGRSSLYTYHVTATSCDSEQDGTADSLTYSWRLPGVSPSHMDGLNSRTVRVDTSELVWQSEYLLTCVVSRLGTSEVYMESLRLRPATSGVRARLPAERRAVQPEQPIYLDGSRSEDLAGRPGKLSYSWSCRLAESGAGCFVGDPWEPPLQRLEQRLGDSALSGPTLRVPAGLLAPEQRYLLTLRVEKDGDVDTAHTEVYVNALPTPKLWIDRQTDVFDPFQDIFVSAQVSTDWPVTVQWETDFPVPPAALEGASFRPTLVPAGARRRHFDLVLPALEIAGGEDGCTLCGKVLRFVLRADMETSDSLVASAEVDLTIMSAPSLGELKARTVICNSY
ncbi:uncharacterized protein LOC122379895 [Amphibalanus amphitrite]|uniref:uncharacterized protein LOC122379895 n=1 Tax=Amphibalanus amphitrite TaxID=1232801 RepID=UPI001C8FE84A|nr:uncharacterized protein LOC122379895 [Amphibalanus amphitrite]